MISIVIPVYNAELYLRETLDSILVQNYPHFEIIIIDDGSSDSTYKIIEEFLNKDQRIRSFYQQNSGAPIARNYGLSQSIGEYIYFFDSDDIMYPDTLSILSQNMKLFDVDLVIGSFDMGDQSYIYDDELCVVDYFDQEGFFNIAKLGAMPGNKLYRKDVIEKNRICFDNVTIGQDLNFYVKYLICAHSIKFIKNPVYNYRVVDGGISRTYSLKIMGIHESLEGIRDFCVNNKVDISNYEWYLKLRFIHYLVQYYKIIYLPRSGERKKAISFFDKKMENIINMLESDDFKEGKNQYFARKNLNHLLKYKLTYFIFSMLRMLKQIIKKII